MPVLGSLGRELQEIAAATLRQAAALRLLLGESDVAALDDLVNGAKADVCRIAVVGQVKAGKSSLINALIGRPRFLPADVNPWTAVVTSLHFGESSDAGAVYQFFDEHDWERLGSGGRLQELSLRLGVALDADTLARQIRLMRDRAELRLGRDFRQLLGRQHRFATASPEALERYVCAEDLERDAADIRPGHSVGRFADITKSADLYFDLPPFAYPTVIMDTPGTNDPFLVRDQLSREVLERADACMVVLNAQQALSSGDVSLLHLLRGLQKDRVVVFVNRIDQLRDPKAEAEAVLAHVRGKLAIEFPGSDIPVIAGSALWAEQALASEAAASSPQPPSPRRLGAEQAASPEAPGGRAE
ncbi:dynamin family protein, partial [Bradyrhizobium sp.]|uniref:dynamin family protein n=1 Tax=Bradyrhizobium sp. TaxID=376 RepID=UPI003C4FBD84